MPRGNKTGPRGQGPGTGKGLGGCRGGAGAGQGGGRAMRIPGRWAGGECVCPKCGKRISHQSGSPCTQTACPDCGTAMTRE